MANKLIIGTRGSRLALYQGEKVRTKIQRLHPEINIELKIYKTLGDRQPELNLLKSQATGVFCSDLENALLQREIDMAIHSVKDLPGNLTPGLSLAAYLEREDASEVLVSRENRRLKELPTKARIGTSSIRRLLQIKAKRADLEFEPIRGNVETRIEKVRRGDYDATVLALAGLRRLGLEIEAAEHFSLKEMIPAPGQGCIGVEICEDNHFVNNILGKINHPVTAVEVRAERAFLQAMNGNCESAVGAYAKNNCQGMLTLTGLWATSAEMIQIQSVTGLESSPGALGIGLAKKIMQESI